jgi:hypothetical protein
MKQRIIIIVLVVIGLGAFFGFKEWNRENADLSTSNASYSIAAPTLIEAFQKDTAAAGKQYTDKIISVTGNLKKIVTEQNSTVFFLGNPEEMSSVQCSMDPGHAKKYAALKEGAPVTVKGICTGFQSDDLLGTDVKLNRCVVESKK